MLQGEREDSGKILIDRIDLSTEAPGWPNVLPLEPLTTNNSVSLEIKEGL